MVCPVCRGRMIQSPSRPELRIVTAIHADPDQGAATPPALRVRCVRCEFSLYFRGLKAA